MAELNLKQIIDKLNTEFTGEVRKLVFWYDANAEFKEDIETMELDNAKILLLEPDNQFYIKHYLECVDTSTHYLIYAPFAKPAIRENHLADTLRYSKEFFADRASLLTIDLGIDERYKPVIQHYIKFFANKDRTQRFYDLEIESFNRSTIEVALMSVLCKSKTASFEEVVRCILTDDGLVDNKYLAEFEKYDLLDAFWQQADANFGYNDNKPTLEKFIISMFVTYASRTIHTEIPQAWKPFVSYKFGNIMTFMDNLMNSYLYGGRFDEVSDIVYNAINGKEHFAKMDVSSLVECSLFAGIDDLILKWLVSRLENEDIGARLDGKTIPEICVERRKKHFGKRNRSEYFIIENAYYIITEGKYEPKSGIDNIIKDYTENSYKVDRRYRYFYYFYDSLEDTTNYENLRELVENLYTNDYLNKIAVNWNAEFAEAKGITRLPLQKDFYSRSVKPFKERTAVIISDALRYEVAHTLYDNMVADEKCKVDISVALGVLPSYTALGMAALLPHKTIEYNENYDVLVDGKPTVSTEQREKILQEYSPNSKCIQFDALKLMKQAELREVFTGQDVIYIYHNQVDGRGDKSATENEVFNACEEAIEEIYRLIKDLHTTFSGVDLFVTADHGFLYKRGKYDNTAKATKTVDATKQKKRYSYSNDKSNEEGILSINLDYIFGENSGYVNIPKGNSVFAIQGLSTSYVHGGIMPQEILVPVIDFKSTRNIEEVGKVKISYTGLSVKITNAITLLDFTQTTPVDENNKACRYLIHFEDDKNERISNECVIIADNTSKDVKDRFYKEKFVFKNIKYDRNKDYYLVITDEETGIEESRVKFTIDIAISNNFNF